MNYVLLFFRVNLFAFYFTSNSNVCYDCTAEIELQNLKITAKNQPALKNAKDMDYNTKLSAIKSSSFVVSLISFSGISLLILFFYIMISKIRLKIYSSI
jgi:hypothetical protein